MNRLNQNGFGLVELLVGAMLTALFALFASRSFGLVVHQDEATRWHLNQGATVETLARLVMRVGRLAYSIGASNPGCAVIAGNLQCQVDFAQGPTPDPTPVRFVHVPDGNRVDYQWLLGGTWTTKLSFDGIAGFAICTLDEVRSGTCALPQDVSYQDLAAFVPDGRFFRVGLVTTANPERRLRARYLQTAFFVRNPPGLGTGILYQWGGGVSN